MIRAIAVSILVLLFLAGCQVNPRYRTGGPTVAGEEQKALDNDEHTRDRKYGQSEKTSTAELERLGRIIQSYLGIPYAGSSPYDKGLDCSQFTRLVYEKYNRTALPRTARDQYKAGRKVAPGRLQYGDLLFFKTNGNSISHVGIYVGYGEFTHASSSGGVIISSLNEKYWKKRYAGARRILP